MGEKNVCEFRQGLFTLSECSMCKISDVLCTRKSTALWSLVSNLSFNVLKDCLQETLFWCVILPKNNTTFNGHNALQTFFASRYSHRHHWHNVEQWRSVFESRTKTLCKNTPLIPYVQEQTFSVNEPLALTSFQCYGVLTLTKTETDSETCTVAYIELFQDIHTAPRPYQWCLWLLLAISSVSLHKSFLVSLRVNTA